MEIRRAWSILETKSLDEEQRILHGVASTPTLDHQGDVVVSEGAQFSLPLPLLWQHDSRQPIGHVVEAAAKSTGIDIVARIAKVTEPGRLKDRLDEAWQSIRAGLVKGLSIGFKALEYEPLDPEKGVWGGVRYNSWVWHELSCVTIAANSEASISVIRSLDRRCLAAFGDSIAASDGQRHSVKLIF